MSPREYFKDGGTISYHRDGGLIITLRGAQASWTAMMHWVDTKDSPDRCTVFENPTGQSSFIYFLNNRITRSMCLFFCTSKIYIYKILLLFNFYWSIVGFQCCAGLCYPGKYISYMCTYSPSFWGVLPTLLTPEHRGEPPKLYSRFSLLTCSIHSRVCMSIPISQLIGPLGPLWCSYLSFLCLCLYFCFANKIIYTIGHSL